MIEQEFDTQLVAKTIEEHFPDIPFAYLFGSAQNGVVKPGSDIDVAVYYKGADPFARFKVEEQIAQAIGRRLQVDIVMLHNANPILAFEALKGKLLFVREECMDEYADFYTSTCRRYEDKMYWMKTELIYRGYEVQWDC
jgi:predicted nucleotidyltransferase